MEQSKDFEGISPLSYDNTVTETLNRKNISVCCLQETLVPLCFPEDLLNCGGFNIKLETNTLKKRTGIYIRRDIKYVRRKDLESSDRHIVIIDVITNVKTELNQFINFII